MFIRKNAISYNFLNEADEENPTESDAEFKTSGQETEVSQTTDENNNNTDDTGMDGDFSGGVDGGFEDGEGFEGDSEGGMDDSGSEDDMDDDEKYEQTNENLKKVKLLEELENLELYARQLSEMYEQIDKSSMSGELKSVYTVIGEQLEDLTSNLEVTLTHNFSKFRYERLLTIFMYLKKSLVFISGIMKKMSQ